MNKQTKKKKKTTLKRTNKNTKKLFKEKGSLNDLRIHKFQLKKVLANLILSLAHRWTAI